MTEDPDPRPARRWRALALAELVVLAVVGVLALTGFPPADAPRDPLPAPRLPSDGDEPALRRGEIPDTAPRAGGEARQPVEPAAELAGVGAAADGTVLVGRVLDPDGVPVPRCSVGIRPAGTASWRQDSIEPELGFAFPGLAPGDCEIRLRADGFRETTETIRIEPVPLMRRDLTMRRALVLPVAVVTPDGEQLGSALAKQGLWMLELACVVTHDEPPNAFPETELRSVDRLGLGRWRSRFARDGLPDRYSGVLEIDDPLPLWVSLVCRHVVVQEQLVPPGAEELVFTLAVDELRRSLGSVRMRVLASETGAPLTGASVSISDRQSGGRGQQVGDDGTATVADVPPGVSEVVVRAADREVFHRFVRVAPGADLDLGDLRVDPVATIGGTVLGPDGRPAAEVSFSWSRLDRLAPGMPLRNGMSASSDTEGRFSLWGCGRGRYVVTATKRGVGESCAVVDTSGGAVADLQLRLAPTTALTIVNDLGPLDRVVVTVRRQDGVPVAAFPVVGAYGEFTRELGAGSYVAAVHRDGVLLREVPLSVGSTPLSLRVP